MMQGYRSQIEAALEHSGGTHTFDDVVDMVRTNRAQFWTNRDSCAVTEVLQFPQKKVLHCFLAGGNMGDIVEMMPWAGQWGAMMGCTGFTIAGRKGWLRVLSRHGWRPTLHVMEIDPKACYSAANSQE